jgi:hypothetical protein
MGIGTGILLIVLGALLAFAVKADVSWLDLQVAGVVLMMAGSALLFLTLYFWRERRRRNEVTIVEEARLAHTSAGVPPDPPDAEIR